MVQLGARIAQTRHRDNRAAQIQPRSDRQTEQIDTVGRDVLAHLPGRDGETGRAQFLVEFGVDQVNLAQVGLGRIARHPRAVLDRNALMRVAVDAEPGHELDAVLVGFDQRVRRASADGRDYCVHCASSSDRHVPFCQFRLVDLQPQPRLFRQVKETVDGA